MDREIILCWQIGYPPSPAVMATHPPPPLSPADKIPTSKEHELFTIDALNTRLRSLLDRDKKENVELERKVFHWVVWMVAG